MVSTKKISAYHKLENQKNFCVKAVVPIVGIGTTAPTEKLDVSGSIKMVDGNQAAGKVLTSDADGKGSWQTPPGGGFAGAVNVSSTPYTIQTTDSGKAFYYSNNVNGVVNLPALFLKLLSIWVGSWILVGDEMQY
ncbi:MAG: hypothetical protein ACK5P5_14665 [Pseudobdellovibrionaceae bacterium]|jgi:hypothetical protein